MANWSPANQRWKNNICNTCYRGMHAELFRRDRSKRCARTRALAYELRTAMLAAYGGACACCGEMMREFLTIDHIDGNGQSHRAVVTGGSTGMARWLRDRGWPQQGFQLLCWNCNKGKYACGICPHHAAHAQETAT